MRVCGGSVHEILFGTRTLQVSLELARMRGREKRKDAFGKETLGFILRHEAL